MTIDKLRMTLAISAIVLMLMMPSVAVDAGNTRAGEVGWQYDLFSDNINTQISPEEITTKDTITVTITSRLEDVWIKQAAVYGVVYPDDSVQFPFSFPFLKLSDTKFECTIEPFPLNGYRIEFYIVAYDYFFSPIDSRQPNMYSFEVSGSGWQHDSFADNVELVYTPAKVNATEDVTITLISRENISISGANLYIAYETPEGDMREGGWNFSKLNVNSTMMRKVIPGYPAGTNVTFWVTAWDQYNTVITSEMYNYSVMGIAEYTDFPFEDTDASGDRSRWVPGSSTLLPMAGVSALAIPLFLYLYAIERNRRRRAVKLVKTKQSDEPAEEEEVTEDE